MYQFHFPKSIYSSYFDFYKSDADNDIRKSIYLHEDIRLLYLIIKNKIRGRKATLFSKSSEGVDYYEKINLTKSLVIDRVLSTHIIYSNASHINNLFKEFNKRCERGDYLGHTTEINKELNKHLYNYPNSQVKITFNNQAFGILNSGCKYFNLISPSLLFNYLFTRWVITHKNILYEIFKDEVKINYCEYLFNTTFKPKIKYRLDVVNNVMSKKRTDPFGSEILAFIKKNKEIDISNPPLELIQILFESNKTKTDLMREVYALHESGLLNAIDGNGIDLNGKQIPKKYLYNQLNDYEVI